MMEFICQRVRTSETEQFKCPKCCKVGFKILSNQFQFEIFNPGLIYHKTVKSICSANIVKLFYRWSSERVELWESKFNNNWYCVHFVFYLKFMFWEIKKCNNREQKEKSKQNPPNFCITFLIIFDTIILRMHVTCLPQ